MSTYRNVGKHSIQFINRFTGESVFRLDLPEGDNSYQIPQMGTIIIYDRKHYAVHSVEQDFVAPAFPGDPLRLTTKIQLNKIH